MIAPALRAAEADFAWFLSVLLGGPVMQGVRLQCSLSTRTPVLLRVDNDFAY